MNPAIRNLNYRLILSLNKGNNYQGVVLIDFELGHLSQNETPLGVNYNGAAVLALVVNGVLIDRKNVVYC